MGILLGFPLVNGPPCAFVAAYALDSRGHAGAARRRRLSASDNLLVVGAYPQGGEYDQPKPGELDLERARRRIAEVPLPAQDPVFGLDGPLQAAWYRAR